MESADVTISSIVLDHYLPAKRAKRQPTTVYGYESSLRLHVLPRFGDSPIESIGRRDVQAWVDGLATSPGGCEKAFKCLRQVIRWAMAEWSLDVADPTRGIELPRKPSYRPSTLTQRRLKRLVRGMVGCPFEPTLIIQCSLGLRPSENYRIRWDDLNWRTGVVPIKGSLHEVPGLVYEATTKTAKGERECVLPRWALNRLHAIWVSLERPRGRIIGGARPSEVARSVGAWAKARRLPWVGMKNLRHTWGTIAAGSNPIETVSAMMGHSSIQTTYRYYYRLTVAAARKAQFKVAKSILGKTCDDMYKGLSLPKLLEPTPSTP